MCGLGWGGGVGNGSVGDGDGSVGDGSGSVGAGSVGAGGGVGAAADMLCVFCSHGQARLRWLVGFVLVRLCYLFLSFVSLSDSFFSSFLSIDLCFVHDLSSGLGWLLSDFNLASTLAHAQIPHIHPIFGLRFIWLCFLWQFCVSN